jgi:outer membrane protein assembly factor BamB
MRGYDPMTGKELWSIKGTSMISVPTPFVIDDLIYLFSGYSRFQKATYAVKPGSSGDLTVAPGAIAWKRSDAPYLPTPIVYDGHVNTVNTRGEFFCYSAKTGEEVYKQRLGQGAVFSASLVAADGRIYASSEDGEVYVVKPGPKFEVLGTNNVGEVIMATPAIARDMFIVRTPAHIFGFKTSKTR